MHFDIAEPLRRVDVVTLENSTAGSAYYTPPSEDLRRLGARFDLQRWHTDALALGPVGLATFTDALRAIGPR